MNNAAVTWMDADDEDDRPRRRQAIEERMDDKRRHKRLTDCTLPDGYELVTLQPRQVVTDGLLVWSFVLKYSSVASDRVQRFWHVARYEPNLADDIQMGWALGDFERALRAAGMDVGKPATVRVLTDPSRPKRTPVELQLRVKSKLSGGAYAGRGGFLMGTGGVGGPVRVAGGGVRVVHAASAGN